MDRREVSPVAVLVGAVCAYELVALVSPLPTITRLVHTGRTHRHTAVQALATVMAAGTVGWLAHHLLIEEPSR
jgi:hypothetical protein